MIPVKRNVHPIARMLSVIASRQECSFDFSIGNGSKWTMLWLLLTLIALHSISIKDRNSTVNGSKRRHFKSCLAPFQNALQQNEYTRLLTPLCPVEIIAASKRTYDLWQLLQLSHCWILRSYF